MKRITNIVRMIIMIVIALISVAPILWMVAGCISSVPGAFQIYIAEYSLLYPVEWTGRIFITSFSIHEIRFFAISGIRCSWLRS